MNLTRFEPWSIVDMLHRDLDRVRRILADPEHPLPPVDRPAVPWPDMVVYEANVRGYTMRHPGVGERERGRFAGSFSSMAQTIWSTSSGISGLWVLGGGGIVVAIWLSSCSSFCALRGIRPVSSQYARHPNA